MTDQRSITPSPELLQLWFEQHHDYNKGINELLIEAVQYGADQELEACCEWLRESVCEGGWSQHLRAARRPSLKKQAYAALDAYIYGNPDHGDKQNTYNIIRRALEQLDD